MELTRIRRWFGVLCLALVLAVAGCGSRPEPSRWDQAQQESSSNGQAAVRSPVPGSALNPFFPREAATQAGFDFTFTQEKEGFVEASLARDGAPVALLSMNDTTTNPAATEKYQNSGKEIAGYPAYEAENVTAILVADRFQVQVFSAADSFGPAEREAWLQQFDLAGLAALS